jgi:hypothetical protein
MGSNNERTELHALAKRIRESRDRLRIELAELEKQSQAVINSLFFRAAAPIV